MRKNNYILLWLILILLSEPSVAVQRFSAGHKKGAEISSAEKVRHMKDHQAELSYQADALMQDIAEAARSLKELYPQYKEIETEFRTLYQERKDAKSQIEKLESMLLKLKDELRQTTVQLVVAKKKLYLNAKFNKKLPPFLAQGNPDEAVKFSMIRLETKEKILYQQIQRIQHTIDQHKQQIETVYTRQARLRPLLLENKKKYRTMEQTYRDLQEQRQEYLHQKKMLQQELETYVSNLPDRAGLFDKPLMIQPVVGQIEYLSEDYNAFHAGGVIVDARVGEEMVSPGNGTVSFRGPLRGFGQIILIDHGGRWHSLVSGVDPVVMVGQKVRRGQLIGRVSKDLNGRVYVELMKEGRTRPLTFH